MFLKIHSRFETFDICLWGRNLQIILVGNTEENSYHTSQSHAIHSTARNNFVYFYMLTGGYYFSALSSVCWCLFRVICPVIPHQAVTKLGRDHDKTAGLHVTLFVSDFGKICIKCRLEPEFLWHFLLRSRLCRLCPICK